MKLRTSRVRGAIALALEEDPQQLVRATDQERLIAAIEEGLADLDAGRSYSHAEVLAEMRERFPPSSPK